MNVSPLRMTTPRKSHDMVSAHPGAFPLTNDSIFARCHSSDEAVRREAITILCEAYWYPLYVYLRRSHKGAHDAEDIIQSYFFHLLKHGYFERRDSSKGRFRSYLIKGLNRFVQSWNQRPKKAKPEKPLVSIDVIAGEERYGAEVADHQTPEYHFERQWALTLLKRACERLQQEYDRAGKTTHFEALQDSLIAYGKHVHYGEIAQRLGLSENATRMAASRMRKRYQQILKEEIYHTVDSEEEIEDELNYLCSLFN